MLQRAVDILVGAAVLVCASPILIPVALAIRLDSRGPVLYRGWRVGKHGRPFRMWKFRTMVVDAARVGPGITGKGDPRITRVGRFLRATKLDEIPQFWHLVVGQMTLVGPRPEIPELIARYTDEQRAILNYKPGITSPGTLHYAAKEEDAIPAGGDAEDYYLRHLLDPKIREDLAYLSRRTIWSDLGVAGSTVATILRKLLRVGSREGTRV